MIKGYTKTGRRIIGTFDSIPAIALLIGRSEDGSLVYEGESKVWWDGQETQRENGQLTFVDEDYEHVLENEIEWRAEID